MKSNFTVFFTALLTFMSLGLFAQTPTITSFSPTSGEIGTTVTITGTNFDATPENNIVYFGGLQATVSSASATELSVNVPAGASHSQISVTTNGLIAYSSDYFNVTFDSDGSIISGSDSPNGSFENSFRVPTSGFEWLAKAGDMDSDGKLDIVTAEYDNGLYKVYQNTSDGIGDIDFASGISFPLTALSNEIELADFDGDGKLDVAAVTESPSGTSFFLQVERNTSAGAGSFSFSTEVLEELDSYGWSIAYGDLNGDGKTDIVVEDSDNNEVSVFVNTSILGVISFAPHVDFEVGAYPSAVTLADINADGLPEILTTNSTDNTVSILQNTSSGGVLSFASKVDFSTNSNDPLWITTADLDGSGLLDVIVLNTGSISTFRNTSTSGISLDAANVTSASNLFGFIEANDFNGDGKPDLLYTANLLSVGVLPNTSSPGTISFGTLGTYVPVDFTWSPGITGSADFDGDGEPDIMLMADQSGTGPRTLDVMRNKRSGALITAFSFSEQVEPPVIDKVNRTIEVNVNNVPDLTDLTPSFDLSSGATVYVEGVLQNSGVTSNDFTNPVSYWVLAEDDENTKEWIVNVILGCPIDEVSAIETACGSYDFNGEILSNSGTYTSVFTNKLGCDSLVTLSLTVNQSKYYDNVYSVGSYDFDGATLSTSGQYTYGPFARPSGCDSTFVLNLTIEPDTYGDQTYLRYEDATHPFIVGTGADLLGDLDGDGDIDVVQLKSLKLGEPSYQSGIFFNNGDGTYTEDPAPPIERTASDTKASRLLDIDKDNDLDLLVFGFKSGSGGFTVVSHLFLNDGTGQFTEKPDVGLPKVENAAIDTADVDLDGDLDLVIVGRPEGGSEMAGIWLNNGNEVFTEMSGTNFATVRNGSANFVDVDGDGDYDVYICGDSEAFVGIPNQANLYINDGAGNFELKINQPFIGTWYSIVDMVDVDMDGDLDIFNTGWTSDGLQNDYAIIYRNDGFGNFSIDTTSEIPEIESGDAAFGDLDQDGDLDLLLSGQYDHSNSSSNDTTMVFLNNGYGHFTRTELCILTDFSFSSVSLADMDGDNKLDMFISGVVGLEELTTPYHVTSMLLNKQFANTILLDVEACSYDFDGQTLTASGEYQGNYTDEYGCTYPVNLDLTVYESPSNSVTANGAVLFAENIPGASYQWFYCDSDLPVDGANKRQLTPPTSGFYYVEVDNGTCSSVSECVESTFPLVSTIDAGISIYPNPVDDLLNIVLPHENPSRITVMDLQGKEVLSGDFNGSEISIPMKLNPGLYVLTIETATERSVFKIVKQ